MRPDLFKLAVLLAALSGLTGAAADELLVTGQVESESSQYVVTPLTTNFQAQISFLAEEGARVEPGDVVVRFDGTSVETQLRAAREELDQFRDQGKRDVAQIRIEIADAEVELAKAEVERDVARTNAEVPAQFIGDLEFEENQLSWEKAENRLEQARQKRIDARNKLSEKEKEIELEAARKLERINRWETMLASFEIRATQPGFVIHGSHPWMRNKFQVGDNVQTGWNVATVADSDALVVMAWINEVDAPHVTPGTQVRVRFDAVPEVEVAATLESLSPAPEPKPDWGGAAYHSARVRLERLPDDELLPGMSALIQIPESTP